MGIKNKETKYELCIWHGYCDIEIQKVFVKKIVFLIYYINFSLIPTWTIISLVLSDSSGSQLSFDVS